MQVDPSELSRAAHAAADILVEMHRNLETRRVAPTQTASQLRQRFRGQLGEDPIGVEAAVAEFRDRILPHCMATAHPRYMGLVNSSPAPAGVLADLFISALNNNGGTAHQFPAIHALEREVVESFSERLLGHKESCGMLLPGGTFANLQGLMLARNCHFPEWARKGPSALSDVPRLYLSEATHFCIERAALTLGFGSENLVTVPCTGRGRMDVEALRRCIAQDRAHGRRPFCVVGTLGTTATGAIDPLEDIESICRDEELWFHVDACYGGAAALVDGLKPLFSPLNRADSVATDPHKWFFMPMVCGMLLHRHPELERETFAPTASSYIPRDGQSVFEPYLSGVATSRRASGLVIWMALRAHGWSALAEAVNRNIELTRLLESLMAESDFEVLPGGRLSVACFRKAGLDPTETVRRVVESGEAWLSTARHDQQTWIRANIVNLYVQDHHVRTVAKSIQNSQG
jgi:aromatic-L-amino-acid decarboxylase